MTKKALIILEIFSLLIMTTGCFPDVDNPHNAVPIASYTDEYIKESQKEHTAKTEVTPLHITDESDNLIINADIKFPEEINSSSELFSFSVNHRIWDQNKVISDLFEEKEITDLNVNENSGPDDLIYTYTFSDNSILTFGNGSIRYITETSTQYQHSFLFDYYKNFIFDDTISSIFPKQEIEELDKNKAISESNKIINSLNIIDITGKPSVYSMDTETVNILQLEKSSTDKYGNTSTHFTKEQEAYIIIYPIIYNNIPFLQFNATGQNENISGASAYVIYGRDGVINFKISGIYDINTISDDKPLYSPMNVKENLKQSFDSIILESELKISLLKLGYIARTPYIIEKDIIKSGTIVIEPVWMIYGNYNYDFSQSDVKNKINTDYVSLISALDGKKIL